jgi:hypothetical protein
MVEKELAVDASGPEAFAAVVYTLQQVSLATVRALVDKLKVLSLLKEPGQDFEKFDGRVIELCRCISSTGSTPANLVIFAAATFLECDVLAFKLKAIKIPNEVDKDAQSMSWDTVMRTLKTKYKILKGQGLWTPQATTKKRDDELTGLHTAINKLTEVLKSAPEQVRVEGEEFAAMDITSWDTSPETAHETKHPLGPTCHQRTVNLRPRPSTVSPSLGAASANAG